MAHDESQIKHAEDRTKPSGKFVPDADGYLRFEPADEEEEAAINRWIAKEIVLIEEEMRPIYEEAADNLATYKAAKTQDLIDGEQAILPAPLARMAVDQLVAWEHGQILRPKPIVSMQPSFKDKYQVVVPIPQTPEFAEMQARMTAMGIAPGMGGVTLEKDAEETGQNLEAGYDHKLRERESINFPALLREYLVDAAVVSRCIGKVYRERSERPILKPKRDGRIIDFSNYEEDTVVDGDPVRWASLSVFNIGKRAHEDDIDKASIFFERTPCTPDDFLGRWILGEYPLIKTREEAEQLSRMVGETRPEAQQHVDATLHNKYSLLPPNTVDLKLVWFHRHVKVLDEVSGKVVTKKVSLLGDWHTEAKRICKIHRNPNAHQLRPYAIGYQLKDPHSDSGSCVTSISRWFQRVATHLTQAEIKNIFLSNNFTPWYDPHSELAGSFDKGMRLIPGKAIPGVFNKDWGVAAVGAEHQSMVPLLGFLKAWHREAVNMSATETGDALPGSRTPASSVAQLLEAGLQQPVMFLRGIDEFVCRMMRLDIETRRQFQPLGQIIPTRDAELKATIDIMFRFPMGDVGRNFRISLTAVDEMLAKEHEPEQLLLLHNLWLQHTQFMASILGPMKEATPAERVILVKVLDGAHELFERIVAATRTDKDKFDLRKEIHTFQEEIDALRAQAEQEAAEFAAEQERLSAANQTTNGAGIPPGPEGAPDLGAPPGMAPQPYDAMGGGAPPAGGIPAEGVIQ